MLKLHNKEYDNLNDKNLICEIVHSMLWDAEWEGKVKLLSNYIQSIKKKNFSFYKVMLISHKNDQILKYEDSITKVQADFRELCEVRQETVYLPLYRTSQ